MRYTTLIFAFFFQFNLVGQYNTHDQALSIGKVLEVHSKILNEKRDIFIYTPKGFWGMDDEIKNLPVIIVLDGESQFVQTVATVDFLSSAPYGNDLMPRSIVIGIPNTNRDRDLSPIKGKIANDPKTIETTGGGKLFLSFITDELIPLIDSRYSTSDHRTIIGHSLGGLLVFEALLQKRNYFDNYICIDPGLGFSNGTYMAEVIDTLNSANLAKENLFFASANSRPTFLHKKDLLSDTSDVMQLIDIPNSVFQNKIESSIWNINLTSKIYDNENHFTVPQKATYDAIRSLYEFYTFPEMMDYYHPKYKKRDDLVQRLKNHFADISAKLGYRAIPMQGYLNSFAFGLSKAGRDDLAVGLLKYNLELYPKSATVYNNLGFYYKSTNRPEKALGIYKKSIELKHDEWVIKTIDELENKIKKN